MATPTHNFKSTQKPKIKNNTDPDTDPVRPLANFPPSIWGDRFLSLSIDHSELQAYAKAIDEPKEELRRLIINPSMDQNAKLRMINSVYRLGLTYLFVQEIDAQLEKLFNEFNFKYYDALDLYTVSVNFQVFRQFGYKLSCDVFNKFKDCSSTCGEFKEYIVSDVKGMLSLYESTQLRIKGESILDEALIFTEARLKGVADRLEGSLSRQVKHALTSPFHRGIQMVEARLYFSNYEEECSIYDPLLNLAKANFNYLQLLHKEELQTLTKWGKEMDFRTITPYSRDRIPDLCLWGLAVFLEPHYIKARTITSKVAQLICVLDDTYDAYATIDELRVLTDAIQRWEMSAIEQLPEYIKPFYKILLDEHTQLEIQLSKEGTANRVNGLKAAFKELARGYLQEAEWRHSGYVPSLQEYLDNGLITSTYNVFSKCFQIGMGEIVNEEVLAWYETHPKIQEATKLLGRLYNDVATFQFESERGIRQVTSVDAYMKTFAVGEDVAIDELKKMLEDAWKDINEECLIPVKVLMEVTAPTVNLARMTDFVYRKSDKFTFPGQTIEDYITLLFIA